MISKNKHLFPFIALIIASSIWGANTSVMKITLLTVPVFTLALIRFAAAAILLLPFVWQKLKISKSDLSLVLISGLFGVTFNILFFFFGIKLTTALNAGIIAAAIPIFTLVSAEFFLKERVTKRLFLGGILGFLGIGIIIGKDIVNTGFSFYPLGDFLMLAATFAFVGSEITSKKLFKKYNPWAITYYWFLIGALTFLPGAIFEYFSNPTWTANLVAWSYIGIFYGIFLSSLSAYLLWQWGLSKIPASRVGFFFYLDPIVAIISAVLLLSERITLPFLVGALCVFVGLFVAEGRLPYHHPHQHIKEQLT